MKLSIISLRHRMRLISRLFSNKASGLRARLRKVLVIAKALREKVKNLTARAEELTQCLIESQRKIESLEGDIKRLIRQQYGPKSERCEEPLQLMIEEVIINLEQNVTPARETASIIAASTPQTSPNKPGERRRGKDRRESLRNRIAHLPEEVRIIDLPPSEKRDPLTGEPLKIIGFEESRRLAERPAALIQLVCRRPKYANPNGVEMDEPGVKIAPALEDTPIEKCRADASVLSNIITSKYLYHLPLYRIQDHYWQLGRVWLDRSTLCGWVEGCAVALEPIYKCMATKVFESGYFGLDDTIVKMLQPEARAGKTRNTRLWAYVGLTESAPYILYDFTLTREETGPNDFVLGSFRGYVQGDAYSGHHRLLERDGVIEVGCWDHARRKFWESRESDPALASEALARIKRLYKIESTLKESKAPPEEIERIRRRDSIPILEEFKEWLIKEQAQAMPGTPMSRAINYALNQWEGLNTYVQDGHLPISNVASENAMRAIATGRKNWLFVGNEEGGQHTAILFSVVQTCRHLGIDARAYLEDVLRRVNTHPASRLEELLPDRWAEQRRAAGEDIRLRKDRPALEAPPRRRRELVH